MTRGFIGALWGDYSRDTFAYCRESVDAEMDDALIYNPNHPDIVTYIMGDDNYKLFKKRYPGKDCVKICSETCLHQSNRIWHNKMEVYKYAMSDFDEIVYLDWDTDATNPVPDDFWEVLNQKEVFQAPLYKYAKPKIKWRKRISNKQVPCGAFVYMRDKAIPQQLFNLDKKYNLPNAYLDEVFYARWIDDYWGGWKNGKEYFKLFEPEWCVINNSSFKFNKELKKLNACFNHPSRSRKRRGRKKRYEILNRK